MLLYDNPISGNCYKVRLLLALLGVDYERRELSVFDRSDRAEVLGELNPGLRVPTLVLDDGEVVSGRCHSTPLRRRGGGGIRIREEWERYGRGAATGVSYLEEVDAD